MTSQPDRRRPALGRGRLAVGYGGSDVLRGVCLSVTDGGITCVVGPNGAGKSTLLRGDQRPAAAAAGPDSLHGEPS